MKIRRLVTKPRERRLQAALLSALTLDTITIHQIQSNANSQFVARASGSGLKLYGRRIA